MSSVAFPCEITWRGRRAFFVWVSNDRDTVVLNSTGSILLFQSLVELAQFVSSQGMVLSHEEPAPYDFDAIRAWCDEPGPPVDCNKLLDAWNMLADIFASRARTNDLLTRADKDAGSIYDKLFRGCSLPAVTVGQQPSSAWTIHECNALARVLRLGLAELNVAAGPPLDH